MMMKQSYNEREKWGLKGILFFAFIAFKPLYIWGSGTMQVSDIVLVALFTILFLSSQTITFQSKEQKRWLVIFFVALLYQIFINTIWTMMLSYEGYNGNLLKASLYYVFNFMVVLVVIKLQRFFSYKKMLSIYLWGVFASCIISCFGVLLKFRLLSSRQLGFFNNPNQLGYYSIMALTTVLIFRNILPKWATRFVIISSLIMNIMSNSKASIIAATILMLAESIFSDRKTSIRQIIMQCFSILLISSSIFLLMFSNISLLTQNRIISVMRYKLINMSEENDSDLGEGRGYDRVEEVGINALWGVGEGMNERFIVKTNKEVHSTYASLIVCYGLIGFVIYMYLSTKPFIRWGNRRLLLMSTGIFLYWFTHNGIRNTMFWVLLAVLMARGSFEESLGEQNEQKNSP